MIVFAIGLAVVLEQIWLTSSLYNVKRDLADVLVFDDLESKDLEALPEDGRYRNAPVLSFLVLRQCVCRRCQTVALRSVWHGIMNTKNATPSTSSPTDHHGDPLEQQSL